MYQLDCTNKLSGEVGEELLNMPLNNYPVQLVNCSDKKAYATRDYLIPSLIKFKFRKNNEWIVSLK